MNQDEEYSNMLDRASYEYDRRIDDLMEQEPKGTPKRYMDSQGCVSVGILKSFRPIKEVTA